MYNLKLGPIGTNCYIISTDKNNAVVIDPGDQANAVLELLKEKNLKLTHILLTHGHWDHIGAVADLKAETGAKIYIHSLDADCLFDDSKNLSDNHSMINIKHSKADVIINDGDKINADNLCFEVLHTPGHTKGSCCFICGDDLITGDTLFLNSIGRTDLPGGSFTQIVESVKKLFALPGDYKVLPGHDAFSTLEYERKTNPYVR